MSSLGSTGFVHQNAHLEDAERISVIHSVYPTIDDPSGSVVVLPHADEAGDAETRITTDKDLLYRQPGVVTLASLFGSGIEAIGNDGTHVGSGLHLLTEKPKSVLNALSSTWEKVTLTVDSGASDTVMPPSVCPSAPVVDGPRTGTEYEVANGEEVVSLGERRCLLKFGERDATDKDAMGMTFQVVDVSKALLSVSRVMEQGHDVLFTMRGEGSAILVDGKPGQRIPLRHSGVSFELDVWLKLDAGFIRPR